MPDKLIVIDTATVAQVVQCLDRGTTGQYPWSLTTVLDLTALLMCADNLALAPGLAPPASLVLDDQDCLIDLMLSHELVKSLPQPDTNSVVTAITRSKQWIGRATNLAAVRKEVNRLMSDNENFNKWIDWVAEKAWIPHTRRLSGLFDETYLNYVARILSLDVSDAIDLHRRSKDADELNRLAVKKDAAFELMTKAYIASTIIRGRYHAHLAAASNIGLVRHPLRGIVARPHTNKPVVKFSVSKAMRCLACIVLYGAFKQRRIDQRLGSWTKSIKNVRGFLNRGGVQLANGSDLASVEAALDIARKAKIDVTNRGLDIILGVIASLGVGVLTTICLSPWIGVPVGVGAGFTGHVRNPLAFHTHGHILKKVAAGCIETEWQTGG